MITSDASLATWMATATSGLRFDLLTLTTHGGITLRWTDCAQGITTADGRVFDGNQGFERSRLRLAAGVQVDDMDLALLVDDTLTIGGLPALKFARVGGLDGASVVLEWAYLDAETLQLRGTVKRFVGNTGPAEFERGRIDLKVRSALAQLNTPIPAEVYQPGCLNQLGDAMCRVDVTALTVTGTVTAVQPGELSAFSSGLLGYAAGYFELGVVRFTSGALAGLTRTVKGFAGGSFAFAQPWSVQPAVGDTFTARPGCPRTLDACVGRFNNRPRFRGTPLVPAPETVA
ncbi:MAG: DUF2163 domain-containing protein [Pseudomonadota bacterium]